MRPHRHTWSTLTICAPLCLAIWLLSCSTSAPPEKEEPQAEAGGCEASGRISALSEEQLLRAIGEVESIMGSRGKMRYTGCRAPLRLAELHLERARRLSDAPETQAEAENARQLAVRFLVLTIEHYPNCPRMSCARALLRENQPNPDSSVKVPHEEWLVETGRYFRFAKRQVAESDDPFAAASPLAGTGLETLRAAARCFVVQQNQR